MFSLNIYLWPFLSSQNSNIGAFALHLLNQIKFSSCRCFFIVPLFLFITYPYKQWPASSIVDCWCLRKRLHWQVPICVCSPKNPYHHFSILHLPVPANLSFLSGPTSTGYSSLQNDCRWGWERKGWKLQKTYLSVSCAEIQQAGQAGGSVSQTLI